MSDDLGDFFALRRDLRKALDTLTAQLQRWEDED
jgi:hypothetical protein